MFRRRPKSPDQTADASAESAGVEGATVVADDPRYEAIIPFLSGQMEPLEQARFAREVERDQVLAREVDAVRRTLDAFRDLPVVEPPRESFDQLRPRLAEVGQEVGTRLTVRELRRAAERRPTRLGLIASGALAAAIALLLGLGVMGRLNQGPIEPPAPMATIVEKSGVVRVRVSADLEAQGAMMDMPIFSGYTIETLSGASCVFELGDESTGVARVYLDEMSTIEVNAVEGPLGFDSLTLQAGRANFDIPVERATRVFTPQSELVVRGPTGASATTVSADATRANRDRNAPAAANDELPPAQRARFVVMSRPQSTQMLMLAGEIHAFGRGENGRLANVPFEIARPGTLVEANAQNPIVRDPESNSRIPRYRPPVDLSSRPVIGMHLDLPKETVTLTGVPRQATVVITNQSPFVVNLRVRDTIHNVRLQYELSGATPGETPIRAFSPLPWVTDTLEPGAQVTMQPWLPEIFQELPEGVYFCAANYFGAIEIEGVAPAGVESNVWREVVVDVHSARQSLTYEVGG